jgi:hypothetical protein
MQNKIDGMIKKYKIPNITRQGHAGTAPQRIQTGGANTIKIKLSCPRNSAQWETS